MSRNSTLTVGMDGIGLSGPPAECEPYAGDRLIGMVSDLAGDMADAWDHLAAMKDVDGDLLAVVEGLAARVRSLESARDRDRASSARMAERVRWLEIWNRHHLDTINRSMVPCHREFRARIEALEGRAAWQGAILACLTAPGPSAGPDDPPLFK